jgi:hypothetical protein
LYTPDEIAELKQELATRSWTPERGAEFALGVSHAESALKAYRFEAKGGCT